METVKRVRFFEGEFLHEADFIAEQEYHRGQQIRHNRLLHTPGIAEGLEVTTQGQSISVSKGAAIDREGQQIVLLYDSSITIPGTITGNWLVVISLAPKASDPDTNGGNTRWSEEPLIELVDTIKPEHIQLARVNVKDGQAQGAADTSIRQVASVRLGEEATFSKLSLANKNFPAATWPSLTCSAANQVSVNGALKVTGKAILGNGLDINNGDITLSGALTVGGSTILKKDVQLGGKLTVEGAVTLKQGLVVTNGGVDINGDFSAKGYIVSPMWKITPVIQYEAGPLPKDSTFTSSGGILLIFASGSGFRSTPGNIGMKIVIDNVSHGSTQVYTNEVGSHKTFVANSILLTGIKAGNHTIQLDRSNTVTLTDDNDRFELTILEFPFQQSSIGYVPPHL